MQIELVVKYVAQQNIAYPTYFENLDMLPCIPLVRLEYCFIERGDSMAKLETKERVISRNGEATIIASNELRFDSNSANGRVPSIQ